MSQYLVAPLGRVINAESYREAQTTAEARWGGLVEVRVIPLESERPFVKGKSFA